MRRVMFILSAMAMVAAASCTKEIVDTNKESASDVELFPMTFTACSQQTKAELSDDGKTILWQSGDQINLFDADGTAYEPFTTSDKGVSVTFEGMAGKAEGYYALYPYQAEATMADGTIIASFPSEQTAVAGSFDPKAFISVAQSDAEGNFSFKNIAALVKFTMPEGENATSATLTANADNELLCGPVKITFDENGNPSAPSAGKMTNAVTLKGNLEGGKTYYFVVRPGIAFSEGLTISIDGKKYRTSSTKLGKTLGRNSVMALPEFAFKEGMPKDLYTAYEHGFDLQIGGQKFNKATYGEATLITKAIPAPKAGIYFLNPGVEQPIGSNVEHMAIVGRYADQRSILTRTDNVNVKATDAHNYTILANIDYHYTAGSANYYFVVTGTGNYEQVILDNISIELEKQYLFNCSNSSSRAVGSFILRNSDIKVKYSGDKSLQLIGIASTSSISSVNLVNNVIYADSPSTKNSYIYCGSGDVEAVTIDSNTLVNIYPNGSFFKFPNSYDKIITVSNNLIYAPKYVEKVGNNSYALMETSYTSVVGGPFVNNVVYYGSTAPTEHFLQNLRNYDGDVENTVNTLTTSPFTSDQIADGNFALPEGTAYGAKR